MKQCQFCSASIKEEAKFCPHCGKGQVNRNAGSQESTVGSERAKVGGSHQQSVAAEPQERRASAAPADQPISVTITAPNKEQLTQAAGNYMDFFNRQLQRPNFKETSSSSYGLVNAALIVAFATYGLSNGINQLITQLIPGGLPKDIVELKARYFSDSFTKFAVYSALFLAVELLMVFFVERLVRRKDQSLIRLSNRIFGASSFLVVIEGVGLVMALLGISVKTALVLSLSFIVVVPFMTLGYLWLTLSDAEKRYYLILAVTICNIWLPWYFVKTVLIKLVRFLQDNNIFQNLLQHLL